MNFILMIALNSCLKMHMQLTASFKWCNRHNADLNKHTVNFNQCNDMGSHNKIPPFLSVEYTTTMKGRSHNKTIDFCLKTTKKFYWANFWRKR